MNKTVFLVHTFADWDQVVDHLGPQLQGKNLFLLEGNLGAGKTTLVSRVAKRLEIPLISSPTYSLIQQSQNLTHVDLYRLGSLEEIDATGFWEIFEQNNSMVFVEWSSKISDDLWPMNWCVTKIIIDKKSENERKVTIEQVWPKN